MMSQDDNIKMINGFLDNVKEGSLLIIYQTNNGMLQPTNQFPENLKYKAVYFINRYVPCTVIFHCLLFLLLAGVLSILKQVHLKTLFCMEKCPQFPLNSLQH